MCPLSEVSPAMDAADVLTAANIVGVETRVEIENKPVRCHPPLALLAPNSRKAFCFAVSSTELGRAGAGQCHGAVVPGHGASSDRRAP